MRIRVGLFIGSVLTGLVAGCHTAPQNSAAVNQSEPPVHQHTGHQASPTVAAIPSPETAARRIPAHFNEPPPLSSLAPTLAPERFSGETRKAYQVALEIPQTLAQLPCFCFCDESHGHKSLHTCYESDHSSHCSTCMDEALLAGELKRQGMTDNQIREQVIAKFQ